MNVRKNIVVKVMFLTLFAFFINCEFVRGLTVKFESTVGAAAGNAMCKTSLCATDLNGSGFKITITDINGTASYGSKYFVPSSFYTPTGRYTCSYGSEKAGFNISDAKKIDGTGSVDIGLKDISGVAYTYYEDGVEKTGYATGLGINSNNAYAVYEHYFENVLDETYLRNIISAIVGSSNADKYLNGTDGNDYYLKFEPVYAIQENDWGSCIYYYGTNNYILNSFGKAEWGKYFASGGNNGTISGIWNVTRNYTVAVYTPCNSTLGGLFNASSGLCYKGKIDGKNLSYYSTGNLTKLNNAYLETGHNGLSVGYIRVKDVVKKRNLTIYKYKKANGVLGRRSVTNKAFSFTLYSDSACKVKVKEQWADTGTGTVTFTDLLPGVYYYQETNAPSGYIKNDGCFKADLNAGDATGEVDNTPTCVSDFELLKGGNPNVSMKNRIKLFKEYKIDGKEIRNLLNTNFTDADDACSLLYYKIENNLGCLSTSSVKIKVYSPVDKKTVIGDYDVDAFNYNNVSYFNDTIVKAGNIVGYCLTYPEYSTSMESSYSAPKGAMLIRSDDGIALTGKLKKKCFVYDGDLSGISHPITNYSQYVTGLSLKFTSSTTPDPEEILSKTTDSTFTGSFTTCKNTSGCSFEASSITTFKSNYSVRGTGILNYLDSEYVISDSKVKPLCDPATCVNSRLLGFGFATKYTEENESGTMPFAFTSPASLNYKVVKGSCSYEIDDDYPEFEFREVDTNSAFPGKEFNLSKSRKLGPNWRSKDISDLTPSIGTYYTCLNELTDIVNKVTDPSRDYEKLYRGGESDCDLNNDYFLDSFDLAVLKYAKDEYGKLTASDSGDDNYLVAYIMNKRNDSMNKLEVSKPKYKIILTGTDIKMIKKYNELHQYDDFDDGITCQNDNRDCKSDFLEKLKVGVVPGVAGTLSYKLEV